MSWITLRFHRSVTTTANAVLNVVTATIDNVYGIPIELFVYRTSDNSYQYPAALFDLLTYPAGEAAAQLNPPSDYYRLPSVSLGFIRSADADSFVSNTKFTLAATNIAWAGTSEDTASFTVDDISIFNSDTI